MSPLDYVYSDTINMLMAMNRRVLDVTGRLSLMAPQPEVTQILKRAGIHNILRIFETETELIKSSEDMILQTTGLQPSDVSGALNQGKPQSEFDQLRSEIGSAFGSGESTHANEMSGAQGQAGTEDDFNQMFHQFETGPQTGRAYGMPPVQPQAPQPPKFQPRQYSQPAPQPIPLRPATPTYSPRQPEQPKGMPEFSKMRSETQRFPTAPAAAQIHEPAATDFSGREMPALDDATSFESPARIQPPKKPRVHEDFDALDEDDDEFKKKSPLPAVLIAVLVIALIGAGIIIFNTARKKSAQPVATVTKTPAVQQPVTPPAPQVPIETPSEPATTAMTTPPPEPPKEIVREKPEVAPKPPVRKKTPTRSAPVARKSPPRPPKPEPTVNQVVFSSTPSGASVTINDQRMGITPFTWSKPFFGKVNVTLSKAGYKTLQQSFEFSGGSMRELYTLEKEAVAPPPPPPPPVAEPERQSPSRTVASTPPPARKAPAAEVEDDPFADIDAGDDDFSLDSEEPEASAPAVRTPAASPSTPRTSAPVASSGGEALIFIASIPPVADVYLGTQLLGKTNVSELKIPAGIQTLKFVKGGKEITKQLTLQPGKNPSQMVRIP